MKYFFLGFVIAGIGYFLGMNLIQIFIAVILAFTVAVTIERALK